MEALLIHGGNPLNGEVRISGAKNAALPILTASLLTAGSMQFGNVPHLKDISTMLALLGHMGVRVTLDDKNHVTLCGESIPHKEAPYEMVKTMRAAILVLGLRCKIALEDSLDLHVDLIVKEHGKDKPIYQLAKTQGVQL